MKLFLQQNKVGLVGLLETKRKEHKAVTIAANIFPGWHWVHNFSISKGRIWVAWNPRAFTVNTLKMSDQFIHRAAAQTATKILFHITFIYGHNHELQCRPLWTELQQISLSVTGAWCIFGDFNTIMSINDRYGGNEVVDHDIQELSDFMRNYEVLEMPSSGAYFTWTNRSLWSKIERVFINSLWYEEFDYSLAKILPPVLLDHSPILIQFLETPKPPSMFQYCDMWSSHKDFQSIISSNVPAPNNPSIMRLIRDYFSHLRSRFK